MGKLKQGNLFDKPFEFIIGSRHVEYDLATITICGETFDLHDLDRTLREIDRGSVYIQESVRCELFMKLEVLDCCGSRGVSAWKGRRFKEFKDMVEELVVKADGE